MITLELINNNIYIITIYCYCVTKWYFFILCRRLDQMFKFEFEFEFEFDLSGIN